MDCILIVAGFTYNDAGVVHDLFYARVRAF
jgi:hypothetical protein